MEVNSQEEKLEFSDMNNAEFLKEDHSKYNFGEPDSSTITLENGDIQDQSFRVQSGKVSYDKQEDGNYLVSIRKDDGDSEKRILSLDVLSGWFYDPTDEYYNSVITLVKVQE
jgi:hypothetical protein